MSTQKQLPSGEIHKTMGHILELLQEIKGFDGAPEFCSVCDYLDP